jgi:hypothetical protein
LFEFAFDEGDVSGHSVHHMMYPLRKCLAVAILLSMKLTAFVRRLVDTVRLMLIRYANSWSLQQQFVAQSAANSHADASQADMKVSAEHVQHHAVDQELVHMLHSLDNPNVSLDSKWASIQKYNAGVDEFSAKLKSLFSAAGESSRAVRKMVAEHKAAADNNAWMHLDSTKKVIEQEEAFKSLIFSQMLQAAK